MSYHISPIKRGEFGELSKIREELEEAIDAELQGVNLMVLQELSDLVGAVKGYLARHYPNMTLDDLDRMAVVTQRAFQSGTRTTKG